jgi:carbon storage regulator
MLVLSRKAGQKIRISDTIVITVLDVQNGLVKIGVDAPRSIAVYREELYNDIRQANQQAAAASANSALPSLSAPVDASPLEPTPIDATT